MTTIIFLWSLLTMPTDSLICSMWVSGQPTLQEFYSACPMVRSWDRWAWPIPAREYMRLDYVDLQTGVTVCSQAADLLPELTCSVTPLDAYRLDLIWVNQQTQACVLSIQHDGEPSAEEINRTCGNAVYVQYTNGLLELRYEASRTVLPVPGCTLPALGTVANIATQEDYQYLAYQLHWYGFDYGDLWQNSFDDSILRASQDSGVPADLLKGVIAAESQFWPLWTGSAGEAGLIQLTPDGADTALRWNTSLFARMCPIAIHVSRCHTWDTLAGWEQNQVRAVLMAELTIQGGPVEAAEQVQEDIAIYANVLRGYWCHVQFLYPESVTWEMVTAVYHAGIECVTPEGLCPSGKSYLERVQG